VPGSGCRAASPSRGRSRRARGIGGWTLRRLDSSDLRSVRTLPVSQPCPSEADSAHTCSLAHAGAVDCESVLTLEVGGPRVVAGGGFFGRGRPGRPRAGSAGISSETGRKSRGVAAGPLLVVAAVQLEGDRRRLVAGDAESVGATRVRVRQRKPSNSPAARSRGEVVTQGSDIDYSAADTA
jgi:hypothetical protein